MRPTVSLCMIVRNEEENLPQCLEGAADLVDEIIVVDTGSTDKTRAVAERLGAKVYDFAWTDDFAVARNESRRHATKDWVFWLDADDRLDDENRQRLRAVFEGLGETADRRSPIYLMSVLIRRPGDVQDSPMGQARLFRRDTGIHWEGVVHEHLVDENGSDEHFDLFSTDVSIRHDGYADAEQYHRKLHRNRSLLERAYLLNPDDVLTAYYIGELHLQTGNRGQAITFLTRSIRNDKGPGALSTRLAYAAAIECLRLEGRTAEAQRLCHEALGRFPQQPELVCLDASLLFATGQLPAAEQRLRGLLALPADPLSLTGTAARLQVKARLLLGDVLAAQGRWAEAYQVYATLECAEAWVGVGQVGVATGRRDLLDQAIQKLDPVPAARVQSALLRAQAGVLDRRWDEARHWVAAALAVAPNLPEAHLILSDALFQGNGDLAEAIEAHRKALLYNPGHAEVHRRLALLEARAPQQNAGTIQGQVMGGLSGGATLSGGNLAFVA